jgi:hypothetical protein
MAATPNAIIELVLAAGPNIMLSDSAADVNILPRLASLMEKNMHGGPQKD